MAQKEDRLTSALMTIMTAVISMLVIAYFAIPVIVSAADGLGVGSEYAPMIKLVLTLMIFAVIVLVVRGFNSSAR